MATYLEHDPMLTERILGAHLIVIGRITGVREIRRAKGFDRPRVFGLFEVEVGEVLYGEPPDRLLIRILSDPNDPDPDPNGERTRWAVPVDTDGRVLLLLARDIAPDLPDGVYAPYFASAFPLEDAEWVAVPDNVLDDRARSVTESRGGLVGLIGLRRLIETVTSERDERTKELQALFPPNFLMHPYPRILEQPDAEEAAQPPAQPQHGPVVNGGRAAEERAYPPENVA